MNHSKESLSHTRWECKYHVVFIPKYGKKSIYGWVRKELGPIMRGLAQQKEVVVEEGDLIPDHVPMLLIDTRRSIRYPGWWGLSRGRAR